MGCKVTSCQLGGPKNFANMVSLGGACSTPGHCGHPQSLKYNNYAALWSKETSLERSKPF